MDTTVSPRPKRSISGRAEVILEQFHSLEVRAAGSQGWPPSEGVPSPGVGVYRQQLCGQWGLRRSDDHHTLAQPAVLLEGGLREFMLSNNRACRRKNGLPIFPLLAGLTPTPTGQQSIRVC